MDQFPDDVLGHVKIFIDQYPIDVIEHGTVLLFHYRSGDSVEAKNIEDKWMLNFVDDLVRRVESVHQSVA